MKGQIPYHKILKSGEFKELKAKAVSFCDFIESPGPNADFYFLVELRGQLLNLYKAGSALGWIDLQSNIEFDEKLDKKAFDNTMSHIAEILNQNLYYWHVFDPTDEADTKPVCGDLLDDISDIYKDLKYSISTFDIGTDESRENAIWQLKFDFETHWGNHCINALYAVHYFIKKYGT